MKVYIKTHGCTNNFYESEIIAGILEKHDSEIVNNPEKSDMIILNICTVKGIDTPLRSIRKIKENNPEKQFLITGCISKDIISEIRKIDENAPLVNTHNITNIMEVIEEIEHGNILEAFVRQKVDKINFPKVFLNRSIGIVPIASGCVDHCTYCSVKLIKGHIHSYPESKILKEIEDNVKKGCKEIWLTSQDNGAYGLEDGEHKLIPLMKKILKIKGDFMVRLGMINPHHALKMIDGLIEILSHEKMFKFVHLPLESGSNEVLTLMKRKYNLYEYKDMIDKLRSKIPDITIATDIIVGFPTETEVQFHDSLKLISEVKPEVLNISKYHKRPNTKAYKMKQVNPNDIKERGKEMTKLYHKIAAQNNKRWLSWVGEVIVEGYGKVGTMTARNFSYRPVIIKGRYKLGEKVKVKIVKTTIHDLRGEVLDKD